VSEPTRPCPICQTPIPATAKRATCSSACKTEAWRRRTRPDRPAALPRGRTRPVAQPAALRACPHCTQPIAIVALLTTPQLAGPQVPTDAPGVLPRHRTAAS
jgi:hypothetical protein